MADVLMINNDEGKITSTNFWTTGMARKGLFYLSTNAGCLRLLVPQQHLGSIPDMTAEVREVVLTRGRMEGVDNVVEIMFDDRSEEPFAIHVAPEQLDRRWAARDEGKALAFDIYKPDGSIVASFPAYLRSRPRLPYMQSRKTR